MISAVTVPANPAARRSHYLKVRDRASFEFALVSAAVALDMDGPRIRQARIALGGVGTKPWRVPRVEAALAGAEPGPGDTPLGGGACRGWRAGPRRQRLQDRTDAARHRACRRNRGSPRMTTAFIGQPVSRVDGRQKVTGGATYAAEFDMPGLAHGAIVRSTVANGRITSIDTAEAERAAGVLAVLTHRNAPRLAYRPTRPSPDPDDRRAPARASGRPGQPSGPADRARDRRNPRTGQPRGEAGARHLRVRSREHRYQPRRAGAADAARRPTRARPSRGDAARRSRRSARGRRGQGRPDLCHPAREPQPDRDARDHRRLGWRPPDAVGQDAVGAQRRGRDRRRVRHSGRERPGRVAVRRRRLRLGAAHLAARDAGRARRPRDRAAGQADAVAARDVLRRRLPPAHRPARRARRVARRPSRGHPARGYQETSTYEEYSEALLNASRFLHSCPNVYTRHRLAR